MATTTITATLLNGLRTHLVDMVSYGRYMIGGTWYNAKLHSAGVQTNGAVHVTFYIERQGGTSDPATRFQLMSSDGNVLVDRVEDVSFTQFVDKILIRFKLGVSVGVVPTSD